MLNPVRNLRRLQLLTRAPLPDPPAAAVAAAVHSPRRPRKHARVSSAPPIAPRSQGPQLAPSRIRAGATSTPARLARRRLWGGVGGRAGARPGRSHERAAALLPLCLTVTIPSERPISPVTVSGSGPAGAAA